MKPTFSEYLTLKQSQYKRFSSQFNCGIPTKFPKRFVENVQQVFKYLRNPVIHRLWTFVHLQKYP